ncbi:DUF397 domain-containing protein [Streptomyces oryzae]|uniref:DUF397 domain-containing protein n=1 Tax=Streptomyces oryzae TaxID=1434886 RepID=A0ABS3XFG8_9ACTN|nr:DUF397 domain-containing protein [Streptomyces oryzae]MBO8194110.1 DUF397 domain-containing protein [Streptomyces oryzae]
MADAAWFKSSYSDDQGGECVEGARLGGGVMAVRDSKQLEGPAFVFGAEAWSAFLVSVKGGVLDG